MFVLTKIESYLNQNLCKYHPVKLNNDILKSYSKGDEYMASSSSRMYMHNVLTISENMVEVNLKFIKLK